MTTTYGHRRFCGHCGHDLTEDLEHLVAGVQVSADHEPRPEWATITAPALRGLTGTGIRVRVKT